MGERLVINSRGDERVIYPEFSPNVPPENIIVYPDKKEVNIDWRKNFNRVIETQKCLKKQISVKKKQSFIPT